MRGDRLGGPLRIVVVDVHDLLAAVPGPGELDAVVQRRAPRGLNPHDLGAEVPHERAGQADRQAAPTALTPSETSTARVPCTGPTARPHLRTTRPAPPPPPPPPPRRTPI